MDYSSTVCDPAQCSAYILAKNFILLNSRLDDLSVESKNARIGVQTRKLWSSKVDAADSQGCAKIWAHPRLPFCSGFLLSRNTMFYFGQSQNPMKPVFDHHAITNKPHNIQIRSKNRTKPVGHYTAPRRKITRVGGNLPLVAQFRVLCRPGLLTAQHSFIFFFLFPLFLPFLLLFSSFFFFSFPPFLLSFTPFLFSLPPPSPCCSHRLKLAAPPPPPPPHKLNLSSPIYSSQSVMHVDTWHAFAMHCDTWLAMCHSHGLPCVTTWFAMCHPHGSPCVIHMARHVSPDTRFLEIRKIPSISEFNEI